MTVEDWLVLTNRADIDEKEMVRKHFWKENDQMIINKNSDQKKMKNYI